MDSGAVRTSARIGQTERVEPDSCSRPATGSSSALPGRRSPRHVAGPLAPALVGRKRQRTARRHPSEGSSDHGRKLKELRPCRPSSTCTSIGSASILDGACRIPGSSRRLRASDAAVSLTDHGSLAGAVELTARPAHRGSSRSSAVRSTSPRRMRRRRAMRTHASRRVEQGYANLIKLSSLGYLEGYYYKPRVDWELLERHAKGIVVLSGCLSGRVSRALSEGRPEGRHARIYLSASSRSSGATRPTWSSKMRGSPSSSSGNP